MWQENSLREWFCPVSDHTISMTLGASFHERQKKHILCASRQRYFCVNIKYNMMKITQCYSISIKEGRNTMDGLLKITHLIKQIFFQLQNADI